MAPPAAPPPETRPPSSSGALLLLRAMIAAANADHEIDQQERAAIVNAVGELGLPRDDRAFLEDELARPMTAQALAASTADPDLKRQLFAAAMLAVDEERPSDREWLGRFAALLGLDDATVRAVAQDLS